MISLRHINGLILFFALGLSGCGLASETAKSNWIVIDNFEDTKVSSGWSHIDAQNETDPYIAKAQISDVRLDQTSNNHFLIKKAAPDGITGNRKAISFKALPRPIPVGETFTIYTRINVESFPNNHSFGLSNMDGPNIAEAGYDAFEPMIRVTDKSESDGSKNDGTLMVLSGYKTYSKVNNPDAETTARPLNPSTWYEIWWVVNNAAKDKGGQSYDVYMRGGEFETQQLVYSGGTFRMSREAPLTFFMSICNTGPHKKPYGNGGLKYDDIYMAKGLELTVP